MADKTSAVQPTDSEFHQQVIESALFNEGRAKELHRKLYSAYKFLFSPTIVGRDRIPDRPVLLVGNHSTLALDVPLIQAAFVDAADRLPFAMADKVLFANRTTRGMLAKQGGILGHPDVCSAMMNKGKDLLVFPGGSNEVNKPVAERYQLKWKERYGFVRLALDHGYSILPVATVGPDEFFGRYMEGPEWFNSRLGRFLVRRGILDANMRQDLLPPIPRGMWGTLLPRPQRVYVSFGDVIDLSSENGSSTDTALLQKIRSQVAESIEHQISSLLLMRVQQSGNGGWLRRLLTP